MPGPFAALQRWLRSVVPIRVRGMPARARWLMTHPLSDTWGFDRGMPVDRYYIERFLERHSRDIRGRVLEMKNRVYTSRFGSAVTSADVMDIDASNRDATLVADLAATATVPEARFDCFVLTQTLQFIFDIDAAIATAHRLLAPGGTLLVTVPCVSRVAPRYGQDADYWRFTPASCRRLFGAVFGVERVTVEPLGNVATGVAFLRGAAVEEIPGRVLRANDPDFPVIIAVRAVKAGA